MKFYNNISLDFLSEKIPVNTYKSLLSEYQEIDILERKVMMQDLKLLSRKKKMLANPTEHIKPLKTFTFYLRPLEPVKYKVKGTVSVTSS